MRCFKYYFVFLSLLSPNCYSVSAAEWANINFPIEIGAGLLEVKSKLRIYREPELVKPRPLGPSKAYYFSDKGVYMFFDDADKLKSVRFFDGYIGKLGHIKIGNTKERVIQIHGNPDKTMLGSIARSHQKMIDKMKEGEIMKLSPDRTNALIYYTDSGFYRFDINPRTNKVESMFK
ncbi:hypothetical protein R50073_45650 [Maricurvus nonylphenolicus]